jgi:hypothetical protein
VIDGGAGLKLLASRISGTIERAGHEAAFAAHANALAAALQSLGAATKSAWATGVPEEALANATPYLQAFGHVVLAWMWLDVGLATAARGDDQAQGQRAAMHFFFAYELPKIGAWLAVVSARESVCIQRIETLTWALIYGGMLSACLGWFLAPTPGPWGELLIGGGAIAAAAGVVLIFVRARMKG